MEKASLFLPSTLNEVTCAAVRSLTMRPPWKVLGTARVRLGHAGPQCAVASGVRHVLPPLPAVRGPQRPDSIRIHRDHSPPDGSGPARGRQPEGPVGPRTHSQHAVSAAYTPGLHQIAVSVLPRRTAGHDHPIACPDTGGCTAAEPAFPSFPGSSRHEAAGHTAEAPRLRTRDSGTAPSLRHLRTFTHSAAWNYALSRAVTLAVAENRAGRATTPFPPPSSTAQPPAAQGSWKWPAGACLRRSSDIREPARRSKSQASC